MVSELSDQKLKSINKILMFEFYSFGNDINYLLREMITVLNNCTL